MAKGSRHKLEEAPHTGPQLFSNANKLPFAPTVPPVICAGLSPVPLVGLPAAPQSDILTHFHLFPVFFSGGGYLDTDVREGEDGALLTVSRAGIWDSMGLAPQRQFLAAGKWGEKVVGGAAAFFWLF